MTRVSTRFAATREIRTGVWDTGEDRPQDNLYYYTQLDFTPTSWPTLDIFKRYKDRFLPLIESLTKTLGGSLSKKTIQPQISNAPGFARNSTAEALYIDFPMRGVYPISPQPISPHTIEAQSKVFYDLYQRQILCDTTLILADGVLKIHALFLIANGGEILSNILMGPYKEALTKEILFPEFSSATASAFIDFIYLGPNAMTPENLNDKGTDVYELLKMVHPYQITTLIDCCTNIISLIATKDDAKWIQLLAELYENEHLAKLAKHLSTEQSP